MDCFYIMYVSLFKIYERDVIIFILYEEVEFSCVNGFRNDSY